MKVHSAPKVDAVKPHPEDVVIQTVPAIAGGGKTYAACVHSLNMAAVGNKILIVQPSKDLIDQTYNELTAKDSSAKISRFYSKVKPAGSLMSVLSEIKDHLSSADSQGEIVLITHAAFARLEYFEGKSKWHVIYDEMPQTDYSHEFTLIENPEIILPWLNATDLQNGYSLLRPTCHEKLQSVASNKNQDDVWKIISEFAGKLISDHYKMYVISEQLEQFSDIYSGGSKRQKLNIFGLLQPTIFSNFASVTLMAACLEDSICYKYWSQDRRISFVKHRLIKPRSTQHSNGALLDIYYSSDRDWSKAVRDAPVNIDGISVISNVLATIVSRIEECLSSEQFVWMGNNDLKHSPFSETAFSVRLPNSPHGLNQYQKYHNAVILSALNPTSAHFKFLEEIAGLSSDEVKNAGYRQSVYQAIGRTSLRDPSNKDRKKVIVMDLDTAEWLSGLYSQSQIHKLPGHDYAPGQKRPGRSKIYDNDRERKSSSREKRILELCSELDLLNVSVTKPPYNIENVTDEGESLSVRQPDLCNTDGPSHYGSIFYSVKSNLATLVTNNMDLEEFTELLKCQATFVAPNKFANILISPCLFGEKRGSDHIVSISGIWLDNDGGGISHHDFANVFKKDRLIIYSTYSSSVKFTKYRVFIPTSRLISPSVYNIIISQIKERMRRKGYTDKSKLITNPDLKYHGFDESKFNPASLFFLPCKSANPKDMFFLDYSEGRSPVDPYHIVDKSLPKTILDPERIVSRSGILQDDKIDIAVKAWRGATKGLGSYQFNILAWRLKYYGMEFADIERTLKTEASNGNSPKERESQIGSIMRNLERMKS